MTLSARSLGSMLLVAAGYVAAAEAGFSLAFATQQVTAVWPPTGIAVAALWLLGRGCWPGVFVGAFIANALSNEPLLTAATIAAGNTLGPLLGVTLLKRVAQFDERLERVRDVLNLALFGAAIAMTVTATNGVLQLVLANIIPAQAAPSVWWTWWAGDAMGALLVAPLLLTWASAQKPLLRRERAAELAALGLALMAASWLSFNGEIPLAYPVFPVVIWTALRFGQRETATVVLAISGIALWATVHGQGPFVSGNLDQRLILLVTFMAVVSATAMLLGAVTAERRTAQQSLLRAHQELERRVIERTEALSQANRELVETNQTLSRRTAELASKNEEVEAFVYIVSHDLRAPLVNLQGFARELEIGCSDVERLLQDIPLPAPTAAKLRLAFDDNIHTALRFIAASVNKFERLIGALLSLSRTGQQTYHIETLDVAALVRTTVDSLRQSIADSGAEVRIGTLPAACGDATAVGQIFGNLLGNALKYRHPDRPARIVIEGVAGPQLVQYQVRDNGAGIPEATQRRLFQVFQRFHPQLASGDGIGLAAVKRIVERHGGSIRAESVDGAGSCFQFTLPSAVQEATP